ncbi:hypothetical protein HY061_02290 [Candidatus Azambacteria bacterium]|nr:hypothetical protein [Candidatus Azambacteria bacterium]
MNPINQVSQNIEIPQEMSEVAIKKMKELHPHLEKAQLDYTKRDAGSLERQREIFKSGVAQSQVSQSTTVKAIPSGNYVKGQTKLASGLTPPEQLQVLVNLAFQQDPIKASLMAADLKDPFVEDRLHDILVEYHEELKRGGKLFEI